MKNISFAFFGTPEFSLFVLEEIISAGYSPSLIITTPDKPAGRGLEISESPVKKFAIENNIPVLQPEKLDEKFIKELEERNLESFIVAAYGKLIPESVLSIAKYRALNVHPSLLPRYRGTSPVESQILADEKDVGVTVIEMDKEMDHGPIVVNEHIDIPNWPVSRDTLNHILWKKGGQILSQVIPKWLEGKIQTVKQNHEDATFTKKIHKEDGLIDISKQGKENFLKYLAYEGWPGVFFFKNGKRIKITRVRYENDSFIIERVIPEGKKEVSYDEFLKSNISK